MTLNLTHAELSNLITACATSRMRHDSPEWQAGLDAIARKLYAARAEIDRETEERIRSMVWRASSYGRGTRHWYVTRKDGREVLSGPMGKYRRFASMEAAQRAASKLNATPE